MDSKIGLTVFFGFIFLLIFSPLAYGAVHVWAYTMIEVIALCLAYVWLIGIVLYTHDNDAEYGYDDVYRPGILIRTPFNYFILFFVCIAVMQVIPLPVSIIRCFFPSAFKVYSMAFDKLAGFFSISLYSHATFVYLWKFIAYAVVFLLTINLANSKYMIRWIVITIIGVGFFESIYGILQCLSGHQHIWGYKKIWYTEWVTGTYINRNHLAGYLEMAMPMAFGMLVYLMIKGESTHKKKKIKRVRDIFIHFDQSDPYRSKRCLLIFIVIIMALALILSGSRGGMLAIAVSFILMNLLLVAKHKVRRCAIISLAISSLILFYGLYVGMDVTFERFQKLEDDSSGRFNLTRASMDLVREFPLLGTGLGTFEHMFRKEQFSELSFIVDHAHNDWLELWVETGIVGLLGAVCALIWCITHFVSLWLRRHSGFSLGIGIGGIGAIISISLHSLTDFNMHIPANALTFAIVIAITFSALHLKRRIH